MSDAKAPAPPPAEAAPPPPQTPAERKAALQETIKSLEAEVRTLEGKVTNRNAAVAERFTSENGALKKRAELLRRALHALRYDSLQPSQAADSALRYQTLRQAALDYFKIANIDPELWKNLES